MKKVRVVKLTFVGGGQAALEPNKGDNAEGLVAEIRIAVERLSSCPNPDQTISFGDGGFIALHHIVAVTIENARETRATDILFGKVL